MQHYAITLHRLCALAHDLSDLVIVRVAKGHVANKTALEECEGADALGTVDDLVGHDEIHGLDLLLQGADGGEGDNAAHANMAQGGDIGTGGNLVRRILVVRTVAG